MTNSSNPFVGIDISKAGLDVGLRPTDTVFRLPHSAEGIADLVARLTPLQPAGIVLEATGGLERQLAADALHCQKTRSSRQPPPAMPGLCG